MSWCIRLILISFCFRRFASQRNLRNPAPELDFGQISLISCVRETWKLNLKAESSSGDSTYSALLLVLDHDLLWIDPGDVGREGKETKIEGSSSCLDCRRGRSKQIFYACWKARMMSRAFHQGQGEEVCKGEGDGPEEVAAPLRDEGTTSENNTMHLEWVVSWRARWNPRGGGLDQAVDLCGNWVTCPSHPLNCNLRCLCSSSSRSISLASTMVGCICRSLAMFSAGCKSTPCLVTTADEKRHEVSFE